MEFFRELISGISDAWKQLSLSARVNIVLAAATVMIVIGVVIFSSVRPGYVALANNLDAMKAAEITGQLDASEIPFQLTQQNKTILVRPADEGAARFALAQNNISLGPQTVPGFELFSQNDLMTNHWLQDIKYMRAVTGVLQRQLNSLEFIDWSEVLIVEAPDVVFSSLEKPSKASVTLQLNREISNAETLAVVFLVSTAGGHKLHRDNITVISTSGATLHKPPASKFAAIASTKLEATHDWEQHSQAKIERALRDLGIRGVVTVNAQMNFDTFSSTTTTLSDGVEVSTYSVESTIKSEDKLPEGAPGVIANPPDGITPGGTSTSEEVTEEWASTQPSTATTEVIKDGGDVLQWVVSIIVEGEFGADTEDAAGNVVLGEYTPVSDVTKSILVNLAMATVGGENSIVTIDDHQPSTSRLAIAAAASVASQAVAQRSQMGWTAAQIGLIILGFFFVRMFLRRAIAVPAALEAEEDVADIPEATREDMRRQEVANEIAQLAIDEPETIAMLLRSWMSEEED